MPVILAFKNILSRRSSLFIILFMAFAAALLTVTNAIFDSTEQGVADSFMHSFTGDFIVRPVSDIPYSLFGDETPVTGNLTSIERLTPYVDINDLLEKHKNIEIYVPQLTSYAMMAFENNRQPISLFGVNAGDYVSMMSAVSIVNGKCYEKGERGVMISSMVAEKMAASVGDIIQFTVANGATANIRSVPVSAIYDYKTQNSIFEKFVLLDAGTFRSLLDISDISFENYEIKAEQIDLFTDNFNVDELFYNADDFFATESDESAYDVAASIFMERPTTESMDNDFLYESDGSAWNFIICKVHENVSVRQTILELNKIFKQNDWPVEAVNWRYAAGSTAIYLYWLRVILNVGIIIVLSAGFIVVNNTLVINVLDRTREIGTMRAIGASRSFLCLECMSETVIMVVAAWCIGIIFGAVTVCLLTNAHIVFSNEFLIQLFGGDSFVINISFRNIVQIFMFMMCLGMLGWIYPVATALKLSPLNAMHGVDWVHGVWR